MRKRKILSLLAAVPLLGAAAWSVNPSLAAASTNQCAASGFPSAPSGYSQVYCWDFATQGMGDWAVQPGQTAGTTVSISSSGLGITVTGSDQYAEVDADDNDYTTGAPGTYGPGAFIQGLMYVAPAANGEIANWPAFYGAGVHSGWPADGEIDEFEGLGGEACYHVHYATATNPNDGPGSCEPEKQYTGWVVFSALWRNGTVTFWYNNTEVGTETLTTTQTQGLIFSDTTYDPSATCLACYGPLQVPSTIDLQKVAIYQS